MSDLNPLEIILIRLTYLPWSFVTAMSAIIIAWIVCLVWLKSYVLYFLFGGLAIIFQIWSPATCVCRLRLYWWRRPWNPAHKVSDV